MIQLTQQCKVDFEAYLLKIYGYTLRRFNTLHPDMQIGVYMAFFDMTGVKSTKYKDALKKANTAYNLKIENQDTEKLGDILTLKTNK